MRRNIGRFWVAGFLVLNLFFFSVSAMAVVESPPSVDGALKNDQALKKAQETLDRTEWTIELVSAAGDKKRSEKDTLRFESGKVESKELSSDDFPASNYTLSIADGGVPIWETMQTGKDSSVVFWRGEVHGDTMRGISSHHPKDKPPVDMSFSGKLAGRIKAPVEKEKAKPVAKEAPKKGH